MRRLLLLLSMLILCSSADLRADTIFNDFGAANSYNGSSGWVLSGGAAGFPSISQAMSFTPVGNFKLTQIRIAIGLDEGTNSAMLTLNSDSGGRPGRVLLSWTLTNLPAFGTCCTVETVTPGSSVTLSSGTRYWIVASTLAGNTLASWNLNNTGATGLIAFTSGGSDFGAPITETLGAFDVQGEPLPPPGVPAPGTLLLIVCGLGGLGLLAPKLRTT